MNKINAVNVWRAAQGLPPIVTSGKTAKAKANGASKQAQSNAAARANSLDKGNKMPALLIALFFAILILTPFACIWAVNTLFGLTIPWTFQTWLAAFILAGPFIGAARK